MIVQDLEEHKQESQSVSVLELWLCALVGFDIIKITIFRFLIGVFTYIFGEWLAKKMLSLFEIAHLIVQSEQHSMQMVTPIRAGYCFGHWRKAWSTVLKSKNIYLFS